MVQISGKRGLFSTIDWVLILLYLFLVIVGWVNIYSSVQSAEPTSIFDFSARSGKQFIWILSSLGIGILILFIINVKVWEGFSLLIYGFTILALIAVIFFGIEVNGSRSWFSFGPIRLQPAEISKIATSLLLAQVISQTGYIINNIKHFLITAAVILIPMLIIIGQSETGSALVYIGFIFMLYREGFSGWYLFIIGIMIVLFILTLTTTIYISILFSLALALICYFLFINKLKSFLYIYLPIILFFGFMPYILEYIGEKISNPNSFFLEIEALHILIGSLIIFIPFICIKAYRSKGRLLWFSLGSFIIGVIFTFSVNFFFNSVLHDYQRKRIEVLLGIKEDPMGVGYNVNQSLIAIGSGGFSGKGYLNGTQTTFGFVPEQSTDFIFCTIGEEWGFIGTSTVILLFFFLIWRIIHDAENSRERFTRVYGYCIACCIFMHLIINIGMTTGLMPVIGIPLPFISYGGSSLWTFSTMLFIFIAMINNERKYF